MAVQLARRRFTVDEYAEMARVGILRDDDRVELIDGEIVEMAPIGPDHAGSVDAIYELLVRELSGLAQVRAQNPIRLDAFNQPQPDFALLRRRDDFYRSAHPTPADVLLIVEVADTSLSTDRAVKLPLYARAGLPEVWLVDLAHGVISVHREPGPGGYRRTSTGRPGDLLRPLAWPDRAFAVTDLLGSDRR